MSTQIPPYAHVGTSLESTKAWEAKPSKDSSADSKSL